MRKPKHMSGKDRDAALQRRLLDLALGRAFRSSRPPYRELFDVLSGQCYNVRCYKSRLEQALQYINRAIAAADIIEGRNENR